MKNKDPDYIPDKPLPFILFSSKPFKLWMSLAILIVIIAASLSTSLAFIFKNLIDSATTATQNGMSGVNVVMWWVIAYALLETVTNLLYRGSGFSGSRWITNSEAYRYSVLFKYMSKHSQSYFDNRFAGALVNKIADASRRSSDVIESILWNYLPTLVRLTTSLILIGTADISIGVLFIIWSAILLPINYQMAKKRSTLSETESELSSQLRGKSVDTMSNITAVHQYAQRDWESKRLDMAIVSHKTAALKSWHFGEWMLTFNNLLLGGFILTMLLYAFYLWSRTFITLGDFVMIITLVFAISDYFEFIGVSMNRFAKNYGEIKNGLDEILHPYDILDKKSAKDLVVTEGKIDIEKMGFNYGENSKSVMSKFNLNIPPKQRVGIVGTSGAGKTTLIKLLLRQHEVTKGNIKIDGQDINDVTLDSLRKNIGIVPQEPMLFHRSVKENIRYGKLKATNEEIENAAKLAQAHDFIKKLPQGYDTMVGERGVKLSAGQKQRVAIARAILKNAPILILDEATSALDSESEVLIQKALEELMKDKTVLAIAHRLSTLSEMDRIIVMKFGKIVEDGNHRSLIENKNGMYAKLWNHQAGGFLQDE